MKKLLKNKKMLLAVLSIVLVASIALIGTYAWFIKAGDVNINADDAEVMAAEFSFVGDNDEIEIEIKELDLVAAASVNKYTPNELYNFNGNAPSTLAKVVENWYYEIDEVASFVTLYPGEGIGLILDLDDIEFKLDGNRTVVVEIDISSIKGSIAADLPFADYFDEVVNLMPDIYYYNSINALEIEDDDIDWAEFGEGKYYAIIDPDGDMLNIGDLLGGKLEIGFGIIGMDKNYTHKTALAGIASTLGMTLDDFQNTYMGKFEDEFGNGISINLSEAAVNVQVVQATPAAVLDAFNGEVEIEWDDTDGCWIFS